MNSSAPMIVKCSCGCRLRVRGLVPGKSGRCPCCQATITLQITPAPPPRPSAPSEDEDDEWNWTGTYSLVEASPATQSQTVSPRPLDRAPVASASPAATDLHDQEWDQPSTHHPRPARAIRHPKPIVYQPPEARRPKPEPWWPVNLLYPGSATEGLAAAGWIGTTLWVAGTLVPEYCLPLLADSSQQADQPMGGSWPWISALPAFALLPFVLAYWLNYATCVLEASSEGEALPPRAPLRVLDGFSGGLGRWAVWLVLGAGVGLLPLWAFGAAVWKEPFVWSPRIALALGLACYPYVLMALLLSLLQDDPLAARPWIVVRQIVELAPSFSGLCLTCAGMLALVSCAFAGLMALRGDNVWVYIAVSWPAWSAAVWISMVGMHILGSYFYEHRKQFRETASLNPS